MFDWDVGIFAIFQARAVPTLKVLAQKCQFGPNSQQKPSHDLFELIFPPSAPKADLVDFPGLPGSVE